MRPGQGEMRANWNSPDRKPRRSKKTKQSQWGGKTSFLVGETSKTVPKSAFNRAASTIRVVSQKVPCDHIFDIIDNPVIAMHRITMKTMVLVQFCANIFLKIWILWCGRWKVQNWRSISGLFSLTPIGITLQLFDHNTVQTYPSQP